MVHRIDGQNVSVPSPQARPVDPHRPGGGGSPVDQANRSEGRSSSSADGPPSDPAQLVLESVRLENLTASGSDLQDVDLALNVAEAARDQILVDSGVSVLAQANLAHQMVLQLLR